MTNFKTSLNMFKVQISTETGNHNLRKNNVTIKTYILRKMVLKNLNPTFFILFK